MCIEKLNEGNNLNRFSFRKALFIWIILYILFLIVWGLISSGFFSKNIEKNSFLLQNSFVSHSERLAATLPLKGKDSLGFFKRIIISDKDGKVLNQFGNVIEGMIKNNDFFYNTAYSKNNFWISNFNYDMQLKENVVILGYMENNTNYTGFIDMNTFADQFTDDIPSDIDLFIVDSNKTGFLYSNGMYKITDTYKSIDMAWLPGSVFRIENKTYFFSLKKMENLEIYYLIPLSDIIIEYFMPVTIPFITGIIFLFLLKLWFIKMEQSNCGYFREIKDMVETKGHFIDKIDRSAPKDFIDCAVSVSELIENNHAFSQEIQRLSEKASSLSENLKVTMFKTASLNQFFQKFSISENYSINNGLITLCKIMIENDDSLNGGNVELNNEKIFSTEIKNPENFIEERIHVTYSGTEMYITLYFKQNINKQDLLLKKEVLKNTFYTFAVMFALKKENRHDRQTGLMSFEFFSSLMKKEMYQLERYDRNGSLMMLYFKEINLILEKYGEASYEKILGIVGKTIKNSTRESDLATRYSVDKILIFFPETNLENCQEKGQSLSYTIEKEVFKEFYDIKLPVKIGISHCVKDEKTLHKMIEECTENIMESTR